MTKEILLQEITEKFINQQSRRLVRRYKRRKDVNRTIESYLDGNRSIAVFASTYELEEATLFDDVREATLERLKQDIKKVVDNVKPIVIEESVTTNELNEG